MVEIRRPEMLKKFRIKKRTILKGIVLLILMVLFLNFYLRPIVWHYWKKLTNTAKHDEKVTEIEPPAITVCLKPSFKPSVFRKLGIKQDIFFLEAYPNITDQKAVKV